MPAMALTCNIDRRGRWVRGVLGGVWVVLALGWWWLGDPSPGWVRWGGIAALTTLGLFMLFEAACGWCAVRALGGRTRI